jgi:glutamate racemase
MSKQPIGILDSGIGGLTIAKEISSLLPNESVVYIGDSAHAPYGAQSVDEIYARAVGLVTFLLKQDAKLIIIACNTITVHCIKQLREEFPDIPIVGTVPVIKTAAEVTKNKRIGILSTSQTSQSDYQKKLIQTFASDCTIFTHGTDKLVPLIERGIFEGSEIDAVLHEVLDKFKNEQIDTLALGCTHFPLIRESIQKQLGPDVRLLDSGAAIARQGKRILEHNKIQTDSSNPSYILYTTGNTEAMHLVVEALEFEVSQVTINSTTV